MPSNPANDTQPKPAPEPATPEPKKPVDQEAQEDAGVEREKSGGYD